jgi:Sporulation and spore germination
MFIFPLHLRACIIVASALLLTIATGCKHKEPLQKPAAPPIAATPTQIPTVSREAKITAVVERAIASPAPAGYASIPTGTKLLGVEIIGSKIRLNFNKVLLLNGTGAKLEDAIKQLTNPISDIVFDMANVEYQILIEGKRLAEFL